MLPADFPPCKTVYDHYRNWCLGGIWQKILDDLTGLYRKKLGRNEKSSAFLFFVLLNYPIFIKNPDKFSNFSKNS